MAKTKEATRPTSEEDTITPSPQSSEKPQAKKKKSKEKPSEKKRYKILAGNGCHLIGDEMAFDFLGSAVNFILDHSREAQSDLK